MELFELKANIREKVGKGQARALRRNENVPAVLYGPEIEPVKLSISTKMIESAYKETTKAQILVNLTIVDDQGNDVKQTPAIIKDVQLSPLSKELLHVDIMGIDLSKKVHVNVPVAIVGKAKGVEFGGLLQLIRREIEVYCMPLETPDSIQLDVTGLDIGDSIHVKDIKVDGIEIPADVNFTVVTIVAPKSSSKGEAEGASDTTGKSK